MYCMLIDRGPEYSRLLRGVPLPGKRKELIQALADIREREINPKPEKEQKLRTKIDHCIQTKPILQFLFNKHEDFILVFPDYQTQC